MSWYRRRLERDLQRWRDEGWVSEAGASAIRTDLNARRAGFGAPQILAMLGAILFGFAIMSFVAANWSAMSKLARLTLLFATLWACYGGAFLLLQRRLDAFAHAAVLGGIATFGAAIMLIAQMYHMEGNPPDAVLVWALGALLAAVLLASRPALAATFVLLAVWTCMARGISEAAHWSFLPVWLAASAAAAWLGWRPGLHLAAAALLVWLAPLGFFVLDHHAHWLVALIGTAAALATSAGARRIDEHVAISAPAFAYAVALAFAGLFAMQFLDRSVFFFFGGSPDTASLTRLVVLAVLTLGLLLAAMAWAIRTDNRGALWIGYAGFAVEVFAIYLMTIGSLLNTSLFFLISALIVSLLAFAAWRLHQRNAPAGAVP